jgi:hypothetical protein
LLAGDPMVKRGSEGGSSIAASVTTVQVIDPISAMVVGTRPM